MSVYIAPHEMAIQKAVVKRTLLLYGLRPWMRMLDVGIVRPWKGSWYQRVGIYPGMRLSAFLPQRDQVRAYRDYRPQILTGYPSSLQVLAESLKRDGVTIFSPRIIITGGEMLWPPARSVLEETFRAPVRDCYGAEELGHAAWECPRGGGYHLAVDCGVFEVLVGDRPASPGEEGELVLTTLHNRAMPFVRYRMGDRGALHPEPCPCGCPFPRLTRITGRSDDLLQLPSGEWVHSSVARFPWVYSKEIRQFQIIQWAAGRFELLLVTGGPLCEAFHSEIRDHFERHLGATVVEIRRVSHIPPEPTGKLRSIICKVPRTGSDGRGPGWVSPIEVNGPHERADIANV
jgi:phenylacetate-CoA ligase